MLEITFKIYWIGFIVASILSAFVIYILKEDFSDESFGMFLLIYLTSALCSWYAVFQLTRELIRILRRK